jgi:hypothetical protein
MGGGMNEIYPKGKGIALLGTSSKPFKAKDWNKVLSKTKCEVLESKVESCVQQQR